MTRRMNINGPAREVGPSPDDPSHPGSGAMTPDLIDLSRRAVTCPRFRWMPGMGVTRWSGYYGVAATTRVSVAERDTLWLAEGWLPDLSDPATLGTMIALVREAWRDPRLVAIYCEAANPGQSEGWAVQAADNRMPVAGEDYETEAAALVAALEKAP